MENNKKTKFSLRDCKEVLFESDSLTKLPSKMKATLGITYLLEAINIGIIKIPALLLATSTAMFVTNKTLAFILLIVSVALHSIKTTVLAVLKSARKNKSVQNIYYLESVGKTILNQTRNRVEKRLDNGNTTILSSTAITDIVANRFDRKFGIIDETIWNASNIGMFIFTFMGLIKLLAKQVTNMSFFYIVIIFSLLLKVFIYSKELKRVEKDYEDRINTRRTLSDAKRDAKEIEPMNTKHTNFMLERILKLQNLSLKYETTELKEKNKNSIYISFINSTLIIIVMFKIVFETGIDGMTAVKFASIITLSQLFSDILSSVEEIVRDLYIQKGSLDLYKSYHEDYKLVYNVYKEYADDVEVPYEYDTFIVKPFEYTYNNTNFTLKSLVNLVFKRGELTLLDCASGGGKSTTAKIAIGEIKVRPGKVVKIPAVKYFNDESKLGSGNLFEEVTLEIDESKVDLEKLSEIIEGTKLSSKFKTIDDLKKVVSVELSNGMYQRMLLARTLYNLGDTDMVIIDEPIGSIDKKTAIEVMRFVKEFINRDKKRFGIVCTHQAEFIEEFIDNTYTITSISPTLSEIK